MQHDCPLCESKNTQLFQISPFNRCAECALIFKNPDTRLGREEEKARYSTHDNRIDNPGYAEFLTPALLEVQKRLTKNAKGLDYGCGPNPVLATLLIQAGYPTSHFDPHFFPDNLENLERLDFITCTEAAEHFFYPGKEFDRLFSLLKNDGILVLMTELFKEGTALKDWYYPRDPTHITFYSKATLEWIAKLHHRRIEVISHRLAVFTAN